MGCDIHTTLVVRDKKTLKYTPLTVGVNYHGSTSIGEVPSGFRNYAAFGMLADGVRGYSYKFSIPVRGRFDRALIESDEHKAVTSYYHGTDWHTHTYVTRSDLIELHRRLKKYIKKCKNQMNEVVDVFQQSDLYWYIDELRGCKRTIEDMIVETDYVVEIGRFGTNFAFEADDWVLLIAFDS